MVIRFRRIIFYSALLLFCMFCAAPAFGSETAGSNANQAGTLILDAQELWKLQNSGSQNIRLAGQQICADSPDAVCIVPVTAPYFDSAVLCWTGSGSPVVSLRVYDAETGLWGDWQPIPESGQRYLHSMGGIFSFQPFHARPEHLDLELCIGLDTDSTLQSLSVIFYSEESNIKSSVVMIFVMILAGSAMYLRRRRMAA